jgi:20S proteasome alpha/beta subunit
MSLVIGIRCTDGIVLAGDKIAVTSTSSKVNVSFEANKIYKIGNRTLFGASGTLSTIQRIHEIMLSFKDNLNTDGLTTEICDKIIGKLAVCYKNRMNVFDMLHKPDESVWSADIVVAGVKECENKDCPNKENCNCKYRLWHIAKDLNDEIVIGLNYYATGIGDMSAYTLLKVWYDSKMDVKAGSELAKKVIESVASMNPLVSPHTVIYKLDKTGCDVVK